MERLLVGCGLLAALSLGCGESTRPHVAVNDGGASGATRDGGSGGKAGSTQGGDFATAGGTTASGSELAPYFAPGSRLKPVVFALDGGPDVPASNSLSSTWYDSELDIDCLFMPDEAGVERCFPLALASSWMYSDAECTRRVVALPAEGPCTELRYPYMASDLPGICGLTGWRVGAELPAATSLFAPLNGSCQPQAGNYGQLYELDPVPPETFVSQRRGPRPRAPGLDAYVREGEDGSWEVLGYVDPARDAPCLEPNAAFRAPSQCLPAFTNSVGDFAPGCEQPVVVSRVSCGQEPPTALANLRLDANACPAVYDIELYEIEGTSEVVPHQLDSSGTCAASGFPQAEAYLQGAAIDLSSLPSLETVTLGSGRVRAAFSAFAGVPYLPSRSRGPLQDDSGALCQPFRLPDGDLHCLTFPLAAVAATSFVYEDAECGGPRVAPWVRTTCADDSTLPSLVVVVDDNAACAGPPAFSEVIAVVGESTARAFYAKNVTTGACEPVPEAQATGPHLLLGEPVDPKQLPPLEQVTRQ